MDSPSTQSHHRWGSMRHTHKHRQRTEKPTYPRAINQNIHEKHTPNSNYIHHLSSPKQTIEQQTTTHYPPPPPSPRPEG